ERENHKAGWYLINQAPQINDLSNLRFVKYHKNLNYLAAYAHFNGLFTVNTELHIAGSKVALERDKLRQFFADLRLSLPVHIPIASNEDLEHSYEMRNVMIALNLTDDPTERLTLEQRNNIQKSDLFSFGAEQQSLLGSIDLVYRNSWNEVHTHHFSGANAILLALKMLSSKVVANTVPIKNLKVFCYSKRYSQNLRVAVLELVKKITHNHSDKSSLAIHKFRVAGKTWQLFFAERGINLQEVENEAKCISLTPKLDEQDNVTVQPIEMQSIQTEQKAKYPYIIDSFVSEGFLQFFFEDNADQSFNVYIFDELNRLEIYRHCEGTKESKVKEINRIYTSSGIDDNENPYKSVQHKFNYPQFYQLILMADAIQVEPFGQYKDK
ncbi:MAG: class I adenylate cyclase, partial [Moraxella sp.]|nr:class I adenylate cyclase [Moraxella sp.]